MAIYPLPPHALETPLSSPSPSLYTHTAFPRCFHGLVAFPPFSRSPASLPYVDAPIVFIEAYNLQSNVNSSKECAIREQRSIWMVLYVWMHLVTSVVQVSLELCWSFISWAFSVITLPARALSALHREKMMERHVLEIQNELEILLWSGKKLEAHFQMVIKENQLMGSVLTELEDEHEKVMVQVELLEDEVHKLKSENLRLQEIQGKRLCEVGRLQTTNTPHKDYAPYVISCLKNNGYGSMITSKDPIQQNYRQESVTSAKTGIEPTVPLEPSIMSLILSSNLNSDGILPVQRKEVALVQSLFSASLSLIVGLVIWEAEGPCTPLVIALFTVVGISTKSIIQFFLTVNNKAASDAAALLSLNWFILGALTCPILPRAAGILLPLVSTCLDRLQTYFAVHSLSH